MTDIRSVAEVDGYFVSDDGKVFSDKSGVRRELRGRVTGKGYLQVRMFHSTGSVARSIHRLVLEAFVGPCPAGMEAAHLNGNKFDNRLMNLAWVSRKENYSHRVIHGTDNAGERNGRARLTRQQVDEIRSLRSNATIAVLADKYNVATSTIHDICRGKLWPLSSTRRK